MARVRSNIFGISGKVGDKVYKIRNGKTFVCRLPEKFSTPMDENSVKRREKFSLTQKFCNSIRKITPLQILWKKYLKKRDMSGKIFSFNYGYIIGNDLKLAKLLPQLCFLLEIKSLELQEEMISVAIEPLTSVSGIWPPEESQLILHAVLTLIDPGAEIKAKYLCYPLSSAEQSTKLETELSFELPLGTIIADNLAKYPVAILHILLVTYGAGSIPLRNSQTIFHQLKSSAAL